MPSASQLIDAIVANTTDWRGATLARLRRIIHEADPGMTEELKWKRPGNPTGTPAFEHGGIVCVIIIFKERVRLTMYAGASLADPCKLFNTCLEGNKWRAIDFSRGDKLDEAALKALIKSGVEYNLSKARRK